MAEYIKENHLEDRIIVAHTWVTETLLPLLPGVRFWYAGIGDWATFSTWDNRFWEGHDLKPQDVVRKIEEKGFPKDRLLLLLTSPLEDPESDRYRLLFKADEKIFGTKSPLKEVYYLYIPLPEKIPYEKPD